MSDVHAFELRRLETSGGGDTLRGGDHPVRWGAVPPKDYLGNITSRPLDYGSVEVTLGGLTSSSGSPLLDTGNGFIGAKMVRSSFGYPNHPLDGYTVASWNPGDTLPESVVDRDLSPGCWYYYSILTKYGEGRWQVAYQTEALVPADYAHRDAMYDLTPPFYRKVDAEDYKGQENRTLYRFYDVVGFDLDYTRTLAEGVQEVWNPDTAPMALLRLLGKQNLGVEDQGQLGDTRWRGVVSQNRLLNGRRGTLDGLRRFVEAASKHETQATLGLNELLLVDDAEFVEGVGHWAPAPFCINYCFATQIQLGAVPPTELGSGAVPRVGDLYVDQTALKVYGPWSNGSWGLPNAIFGDNNRSANLIYINRRPTPSDGNDGDFFLNDEDRLHNLLYGPKKDGEWGTGRQVAGIGDTSSTTISLVPESEVDDFPSEAV